MADVRSRPRSPCGRSGGDATGRVAPSRQRDLSSEAYGSRHFVSPGNGCAKHFVSVLAPNPLERKMTRPYYPLSRFDRRQYRGQAAMLRLLAGMVLAVLVVMALLASGKAQAAQPMIRFDGGIGSQPLASGGIVNG